MIKKVYNDLLIFNQSELKTLAKYYNIKWDSKPKVAMKLSHKIVKKAKMLNSTDIFDLELGENTGNIKNIKPEDLDYKYIQDLGQGAYGSVKLYMRPSHNDMVAIKYIKKNNVKPQQLKYLENELNTLMILSNNETGCKQNIVCYYDFFTDDQFYYIVMEYIPWSSLQTLINLNAFIFIRHKIHILHNICNAILFTHNNNFAHRDIKPDNVMVDIELAENPGGKPNAVGGTLDIKLIDFGFSCFDTNKRTIGDKCSGTVGSPLYMAPELLSSDQQPGQFRKADVYSFGVLMYYFLTGKKLYNARTIKDLIRQVQANKYPTVSFPYTNIADLIDDCLIYNPYERPDMKSVCERLNKIKNHLYKLYESRI